MWVCQRQCPVGRWAAPPLRYYLARPAPGPWLVSRRHNLGSCPGMPWLSAPCLLPPVSALKAGPKDPIQRI